MQTAVVFYKYRVYFFSVILFKAYLYHFLNMQTKLVMQMYFAPKKIKNELQEFQHVILISFPSCEEQQLSYSSLDVIGFAITGAVSLSPEEQIYIGIYVRDSTQVTCLSVCVELCRRQMIFPQLCMIFLSIHMFQILSCVSPNVGNSILMETERMCAHNIVKHVS